MTQIRTVLWNECLKEEAQARAVNLAVKSEVTFMVVAQVDQTLTAITTQDT